MKPSIVFAIALSFLAYFSPVTKAEPIKQTPVYSKTVFQLPIDTSMQSGIANRITQIQKDIETARLAAIQAQQQAEQAQAEEIALAARQAATTSQNSSNGGCNDPKSCIYYHESGNNPSSMNSAGCYGLGQDCNGIVLGRCGADYACQDAYFTQYMLNRYGSWEHAWAVWQSQNWW